MSDQANNWARVVEAIISAADSIAKNPLAFVAAFFSVLFFIFQMWGRDDCNYWRDQYEVERTKNNDLQNSLLIRNGIISDLRQEKQLQDSIIKDMTYDSTINILEHEVFK